MPLQRYLTHHHEMSQNYLKCLTEFFVNPSELINFLYDLFKTLFVRSVIIHFYAVHSYSEIYEESPNFKKEYY